LTVGLSTLLLKSPFGQPKKVTTKSLPPTAVAPGRDALLADGAAGAFGGAALIRRWRPDRRRLSVVSRTLAQHAVVSLLVLGVVGATAAIVCVRVVQAQALSQAEGGGEVVATRVVAPLVNQGVYDGNDKDLKTLDEQVRIGKAGSTIQRVKVWAADGLILYSDDPRQLGQRYPLPPEDLKALNTGTAYSDVSDLSKSENQLDRVFGESLEVYVGTKDALGRPILVETYFAVDRLHADEAALIRRIVPVVLAALLVLGLLLVPLAYSLASRVARYERERQAMIRLAVEASSAERRRVAGELHDGVIQDLAGVGYALTALDSQIASLGNTGTNGSSTPPIGALRATLRTAQRLVHDDVLALRELTGMQYAADSGAADPAAALRVIVDGLRDDGMTVEMVVDELPTLPAAHRAALIRVGREALRNAAKHARGANVTLTLGAEEDEAFVMVADNGPGFDPASALGPVDGHIGLALLADAAEGVGGRLDLRSRPGKGTIVRLGVPIPPSLSYNGGSTRPGGNPPTPPPTDATPAGPQPVGIG
jgi:two-component system, NarL family, sensor kinase